MALRDSLKGRRKTEVGLDSTSAANLAMLGRPITEAVFLGKLEPMGDSPKGPFPDSWPLKLIISLRTPPGCINRGNMITNLQELAKLKDLPKLRALVLLDNPCTDESNYRQEALVQMAQLERLDKDFYEDDDRAEAEEIRQRIKEEQEQEAEPEHDSEVDQPSI